MLNVQLIVAKINKRSGPQSKSTSVNPLSPFLFFFLIRGCWQLPLHCKHTSPVSYTSMCAATFCMCLLYGGDGSGLTVKTSFGVEQITLLSRRMPPPVDRLTVSSFTELKECISKKRQRGFVGSSRPRPVSLQLAAARCAKASNKGLMQSCSACFRSGL